MCVFLIIFCSGKYREKNLNRQTVSHVFCYDVRRIEGGVGGSIAPTAISTIKRSG